MNALDRVTDALRRAGSDQHYGGNWNCPGPMHDNGDMKPSLSVAYNGTNVVLYCHVGCSFKEIMDVIGLKQIDATDKEQERREVNRYPYLDADGEILFAKIRYEPKDFRIEHPNGGGWEKSIGDAPKVLYHLPEVKAAIVSGETIYVTEGEKDADRLADLGFIATCNIEGASGGKPKWIPEYTAQMSGARNVIIIADRDDVGVHHAKGIANLLKGSAENVRVVQSKTTGKGDDVTDHLDAGYALDQLERVGVPGARIYKTVSLSATMKRGVPAPVLLCDGLLYEGGLHSIAGAPDCGKTTLALFWAVQLLQQGRSVVFLDEEGGEEIITEKLQALGASSGNLELLTYCPFPARSWTDEDVQELLSFSQEIGPAMMLIDSSAAFLARAGLDENSAASVTNFWSRVLTPIAREVHAAVVVIDHDTKSSEASRYARGSGAKLAALDCQFKCELVTPFTREQNGLLKVKISKDRRGWLHRDWQVTVSTGNGLILPQFTHDDSPEEIKTPPAVAGSGRKRALYKVLDGFPRTYSEINEILHDSTGYYWKRTTFSEVVNEMLRDELVVCVDGRGRENKWMRKDLAMSESAPDVTTPADDFDNSYPF